MEHPVKTAPCPLYFAHNGGTFSALGLPKLADYVDEESQLGAALLCDVAFDCGTCPLLHQWVQGEAAAGWDVGWECTKCLSESFQYERDNPDVERRLPGFYTSGRPLTSPDHEDHDPDHPPLTGCTSCGWGSSFLQLVLRRPRRR